MPRWEVPGWRDRLGIIAGITGRGPGASPFDLGLRGQAPIGEVMTRWQAFRETIPECPIQVIAHQVHGDRVVWHAPAPGAGWWLGDASDGHATDRRGVLLMVTVADCVPIYLAAPAHGAIALLHAGWRGTAAGILERGVALLGERVGAVPGELQLHLGVAISGPRYQVGAEVMAAVGAPAPPPGPWHLDLREVLAARAHGLGIRSVTQSGLCTSRDGTAFFSHRRSGGTDGRMVAYLGLPAG